MKKLTKVLLALLMTIGLVACQGSGEENQKENVGVELNEDGTWTPKDDVNFIVGFDAGGTADIPARIMAKYLTSHSEVNFSVTNIVGSGGRVAAEQVKNSEVDPHTIMHLATGHYLQAATGVADFTYLDFTPVTTWVNSWLGLAVSADSKYKTYEEFIDAARKNPNEVVVGTVSGTLPQLAVLAIQEKEDVQFKLVDLGLNNKATELLGGRIDAYVDGLGNLGQYSKADQFEILVKFSQENEETPGFEDVPSAESLGYKEFDYIKQPFGLWMTKDTPKEVVDYYVNLFNEVAKDEEFIEELASFGYGSVISTQEEYIQDCENMLEQTKNAVAGMVN